MMAQLELLTTPTAALTRGQRLDMLRRAHRRWVARERSVDRIVRIVAPHLRGDEAPEVPTWDALDELTPTTVRLRGVA